MTIQVSEIEKEIHLYQKIFTRLDKSLEKRILDHLSCDKNKDWLYRTIYNNCHFDFCRYLSELSGLLKVDSKFNENIYSILNNKNNPNKLRFFAYYVIYTYYRRNKDYSVARQYMDKYFITFQDEPMFQVTRNMILEKSNDLDEIEQGIKISHELTYSDAFKNNVGIFQSYAESVINGIERETDFIIKNRHKYLNRAIELMQTALNKKKYAKYFFTYGRLLFYSALSNQNVDRYKKAKRAILKGIDTESSKMEDYSLRIIEYQSYLTRINTQLDMMQIIIKAKNINNEPKQANIPEEIPNSNKTIFVQLEGTTKETKVELGEDVFLALELKANEENIPIDKLISTVLNIEARKIKRELGN